MSALDRSTDNGGTSKKSGAAMKPMNKSLLRRAGVMIAALTLMGSTSRRVHSDEPAAHPDLEFFSSDQAIKDIAKAGSPIAVWETLEHGERVECLDCISYVEPLLFDKDARVREISAWWLRRRVFGYPEVALRTRDVLTKDADPVRRAAAANALGEFLDAGATPLLVAAMKDSDATVRAAVVAAVQRINDSAGASVISAGLIDSDATVKRAALEASIHLAGFQDVASVTALLGDGDSVVRTRACDALGVFQANAASAGLQAIARADSDESARIAAVNALGELGDGAARAALTQAQTNDSSTRVRDAAKIALLKLVAAP